MPAPSLDLRSRDDLPLDGNNRLRNKPGTTSRFSAINNQVVARSPDLATYPTIKLWRGLLTLPLTRPQVSKPDTAGDLRSGRALVTGWAGSGDPRRTGVSKPDTAGDLRSGRALVTGWAGSGDPRRTDGGVRRPAPNRRRGQETRAEQTAGSGDPRRTETAGSGDPRRTVVILCGLFKNFMHHSSMPSTVRSTESPGGRMILRRTRLRRAFIVSR